MMRAYCNFFFVLVFLRIGFPCGHSLNVPLKANIAFFHVYSIISSNIFAIFVKTIRFEYFIKFFKFLNFFLRLVHGVNSNNKIWKKNILRCIFAEKLNDQLNSPIIYCYQHSITFTIVMPHLQFLFESTFSTLSRSFADGRMIWCWAILSIDKRISKQMDEWKCWAPKTARMKPSTFH